MTGSHGGDSKSSSSRTIQELEVDGYWYKDSIHAGDTLYYSAELDSGVLYKIFWDDAYQGSGEYDADIAVSAADSGKDLGYWFGFADNGYQGRSFKATGSNLLIRVISFDDGEEEDSPARTFALAIDYGAQNSSSSSGKWSSARSSSSCMAISMSSGYKPSSSSIYTTGYSSISYPSSSLNGKIQNLDVSYEWSEVHLRYGDTLTLLTSVQPGAQYTLQWMDAYDYIEREIQEENYPTADIEVSLVNGNTTLFVDRGDGALPYTFYAQTSQLKMVVKPNYSKLDTGFFFMRVSTANKKVKPLKVSTDWRQDTLFMDSDTIEYFVDLELDKKYRIDLIDREFGLPNNDGIVGGKYSFVRSPDSDQPSYFTEEFSREMDSYFTPIPIIATSSKISLKIFASMAGSYQVRVIPLFEPYARVVTPDTNWLPDYIGNFDTITYKIPTVDTYYYQIQVDNFYGSGLYNCPYGFQYKLSDNGDWLTSVVGVSSISGEVQDSYHNMAKVKATGDTLYVRVISTDQTTTFFTLLFRVKAIKPPEHIQIPSLGGWNQYTQNSGDTTIVHAGVTKGQAYQIQWDDASEGSGGAVADVKFWFKDGSAGNWVGYMQNGYNTMIRVTPTSDSLYLKFTGTPGIFWYRILPYAPQELNLDVDAAEWRQDTLRQLDTIWYLASNLSVGETYRLQWDDAEYSSDLAKIKVDAYMANKVTRYPQTWLETGSTLNTIVADESTIWFRVTGISSSQFGPLRIRLTQRSGRQPEVAMPGKIWNTGMLETFDTLSFKIPVTAGKQYRVQLSSGMFGYVVSNGNVGTERATDGNLVHFALADTITLRIASDFTGFDQSYSFRVYELVPVKLDWSPDFPIWVDSYPVEQYDMVAFEVTGLEMGRYYHLNWNDGLEGTGEYFAQVQVSMRRPETGTLILVPLTNGYVSPRIFFPYDTSAFIYVSAESGDGQFAISIRQF